ncbi:genetic suppressor element 1-like isoform X4 [Arapaima gigas]
MFGLKPPLYYLPGMSHEPKSPSLGMISATPRTTATVTPLALNGSVVPNGSPAVQSTHSGFAAALRKLAKQAEEPRGSSISSESSPVSSPATNHSSPVSTPKRGPAGPIIVPPGGHSVPSTPPVVTIAPTKTVNGLWRSESRQGESGPRGASRDRLCSEPIPPQEKGGPSLPAHLISNPYAFGLAPRSMIQDSRFQPLNSLSRQMHHVVPPAGLPEEYLRSFRPYATAEDLRMSSLPLGLDPAAAAAAAAAAYYHPGYLPHPSFSPYSPHASALSCRMDDSFCLSTLRSPFYPLSAPGALPPLPATAVHMPLPGVRYPGDLTHPSLSSLQSEQLSERLQMEEELRQREREREKEREREAEREKERERERERELEREREREREREKEREREREAERQKERERERERAREKELQASKALENQYLAELHALRTPAEDRAKAAGRLTPNRPVFLPFVSPDKAKDPGLPMVRPVQPGLHPSLSSAHPAMPGLLSAHGAYLGLSGTAPGAVAAAMMLQRANEEERWLARQRRLRQEKEDRQYQVSEFRQQVLEQHLELSRPGEEGEQQRAQAHRFIANHHEPPTRDLLPPLGAPPPLISPKPHSRDPLPPPPPPATLWNPISLIESGSDSRRAQEPAASSHYEPGQAAPGRQERHLGAEKSEEGSWRKEGMERYPSVRGTTFLEPSTSLAELEKSTQSFLNQQRTPLPSQYGDLCGTYKAGSPRGQQGPAAGGPDPTLIYDEFLQQHRQLVSKLDLEERRRKEAKEKGYYYDLDDSYDESDEEEVRAHLRRVAEQPPLKLDESSEKVDFLQVLGLTTRAHRDELLQKKQRKRRRMLRERSLSPPAVQSKRQTPPPALSPLSTRFTAEQMNSAPELEEKKKFLTVLSLSHVTEQQRKAQEKVAVLLEAVRQRNVTLDSIRHGALPLCEVIDIFCGAPAEQTAGHPSSDSDPQLSKTPSPSLPDAQKPPDFGGHAEQPKPPREASGPKEPPAAPFHSRVRHNEGLPAKRNPTLLNSTRPVPRLKEDPHELSGKSRAWESFTAEEFAQQFHESVLQSTQKALQKHKGRHPPKQPHGRATRTHPAPDCTVPRSPPGGSAGMTEPNHKLDSAVHYNIPELQGASSRPSHPQVNGEHCPPPARQDAPGLELSGEEESEEEEEGEEEEAASARWQGIEAVFEAYQEYIEEQNVERQVLLSHCRRLEAHHYSLSLTAERLSHTWGELMAQKQKLASEREKLQAELDHFRKCLALPPLHWSRGYFKGYPPR